MYLKLQGLQGKLWKTDQLYSVVQSDTSLLNVRSYSKWKGAAYSCCMDTVSHTTLFQGHIIFGDKLRKKIQSSNLSLTPTGLSQGFLTCQWNEDCALLFSINQPTKVTVSALRRQQPTKVNVLMPSLPPGSAGQFGYTNS